MDTNTNSILLVMKILFWVVFIGLLIQTGALLITFIISLYFNAAAANNLYLGLNLSELYSYNIRYYSTVVSSIIFLAALKSYIAFLVIQIFIKVDFSSPFTAQTGALLLRISHVALMTGFLAAILSGYSKWLLHRGVSLPHNYQSEEFLFLAGIIFIIALVFNKGVEIQSENELTI